MSEDILEYKHENKILKERIDELNMQIRVIKDNRTYYKKENSKLKCSVVGLEAKNAELEAKLKETIKQCNADIREYAERAKSLEETNEKLAERVNVIKDNRKYYEKEATKAKNKCVSLRNKITKASMFLSESECPFAMKALDVLFRKKEGEK